MCLYVIFLLQLFRSLHSLRKVIAVPHLKALRDLLADETVQVLHMPLLTLSGALYACSNEVLATVLQADEPRLLLRVSKPTPTHRRLPPSNFSQIESHRKFSDFRWLQLISIFIYLYFPFFRFF